MDFYTGEHFETLLFDPKGDIRELFYEKTKDQKCIDNNLLPVEYFASIGNLSMVMMYVKECNVSVISSAGHALDNGHVHITKKLYKYGEYIYSPVKAIENDQLESVKWVLKHNNTFLSRKAFMEMASFCHRNEILKYIVELHGNALVTAVMDCVSHDYDMLCWLMDRCQMLDYKPLFHLIIRTNDIKALKYLLSKQVHTEDYIHKYNSVHLGKEAKKLLKDYLEPLMTKRCVRAL